MGAAARCCRLRGAEALSSAVGGEGRRGRPRRSRRRPASCPCPAGPAASCPARHFDTRCQTLSGHAGTPLPAHTVGTLCAQQQGRAAGEEAAGHRPPLAWSPHSRRSRRTCRSPGCRSCRWAGAGTRSSRCSSPPPAAARSTRRPGASGPPPCSAPARTAPAQVPALAPLPPPGQTSSARPVPSPRWTQSQEGTAHCPALPTEGTWATHMVPWDCAPTLTFVAKGFQRFHSSHHPDSASP